MSNTSSRPAFKLKLSTPSISNAADFPSSSSPKIKLKLGNPSKQSTMAVNPPKEKKPRKPRVKKITTAAEASSVTASPTRGKKRANPDIDVEDHQEIAPEPDMNPPIKKLRLTASRTPMAAIIRKKTKGKPPSRPLGVGYDSESSDRETDPAIEEEFVLRMQPGEDCDLLRKAIAEKRIGIPIRDGGLDIWMRFFTKDGRRAVICIKGRMYAGVLVDLPCVVEGMKSWDRKGFWKSADICQMLLVTGPIANEQTALTAPLPSIVDPQTFQYPHGLTPPMHFARRRRFRKRISNHTIEAVEDEVERLLALDQKCEPGTSKYEILDLDRFTRDGSTAHDSDGEGGYDMLGNAGMAGQQDYDIDTDAQIEGDSYFDDIGEDLEADLEMAMMEDGDVIPSVEGTAAASPASQVIANMANANGAGSLAATSAAAEDSGDESEEDDEEEELDDEALERQQDLQRQQEEIADLQAEIHNKTAELEKLTNPLLRVKVSKMIASLKSDLELKRGAIGEEE
ncbi:hypothetical protein FGG08_004581 [Glutinoglossum americanum]|uniref:TAFII55 protein conserved region domain-containing protein n=1 Tax=Glutinoglossum americanum TaxID=1670608 RepID=A0A9P8I229_9PEZI|nr:hypothetical protein FGG08_004581 [Glutinoglossum americanum]